MGDLISRSALLLKLREEVPDKWDADINYFICNAPTVEAELVKHGKWIRLEGDWKSFNTNEPLEVHQCSSCGNYFIHAPYNYCPNCGANMKDGGV